MEKALRRAAGGIAIAMSLYHMWFAASAPPEAMIFRGTHLLFALVLVYLFYPAGGREGSRRRAGAMPANTRGNSTFSKAVSTGKRL